MTEDELLLRTALEPMRKQSYEQGFEGGTKQGVLNVYLGLLHWIRDDMTEEERKAAADTTRPIREWMRKEWPHIDEYFGRMERRLG